MEYENKIDDNFFIFKIFIFEGRKKYQNIHNEWRKRSLESDETRD